MDKLSEIARDVFYTPIFMKKNRPAYKLSILGEMEKEEDILDILFKHSSTIGIRKYKVDRVILDRKIINVETKFGKGKVKVTKYKDKEYVYPEYETAKKIAEEKDISIIDVLDEIKNSYKKISKN